MEHSKAVAYNPIRHGIQIPAGFRHEWDENADSARSLIREWSDKRMQHRECLIRAALLRFLTPQEIALTSETKSKAILDYHGLTIEYVNPPGALRSGMKAFIPETLRIYKGGKLALSLNLEMNQEAPTARPRAHRPKGEGK